MIAGTAGAIVPAQQAPAKPPATAPARAAAAVPAADQVSSDLPAPLPRPPASFKAPFGQRWSFDVEWRIWRAGTAVIETSVSPSGEGHVHGTADSIGTVGLLYHVADRYDSYFKPDTFCSSRIEKHTEEGSHRKETRIAFDYPRGKAVLDETDLKNNKAKREEHDIPACATDVLSALIYAGSLPYDLGTTHKFPINDGNKTVEVTVQAEAREEIKTPAGTFRTIRVQPTAPAGVLKNKGSVWVWYTDDAQHLLVQAKSHMFWGTLTIRL